ncbi:hypothetical protein ACIBF1_16640 [Spirillospora sp. NPDC050679]
MRKLLSASVATAALAGSLAAVPAAQAAAAPAPTKISDFRFVSEHYGLIRLSGKMTATGATALGGRQLIVEYATAKNGKWVRLPLLKGYKPLVTGRLGGFQGTAFVGYTVENGKKRVIGAANSYWRVRFAGDAKLRAATSGVVRDPRIDSSITSWKITTKLRKGGYVYVSGVLKHQVGGPGKPYVPYKGRLVYINGLVKGEKEWYWYARPKTDAKGRFSAKFRVYKDTQFQAIHYADKGHYSASVPPVNVDVR